MAVKLEKGPDKLYKYKNPKAWPKTVPRNIIPELTYEEQFKNLEPWIKELYGKTTNGNYSDWDLKPSKPGDLVSGGNRQTYLDNLIDVDKEIDWGELSDKEIKTTKPIQSVGIAEKPFVHIGPQPVTWQHSLTKPVKPLDPLIASQLNMIEDLVYEGEQAFRFNVLVWKIDEYHSTLEEFKGEYYFYCAFTKPIIFRTEGPRPFVSTIPGQKALKFETMTIPHLNLSHSQYNLIRSNSTERGSSNRLTFQVELAERRKQNLDPVMFTETNLMIDKIVSVEIDNNYKSPWNKPLTLPSSYYVLKPENTPLPDTPIPSPVSSPSSDIFLTPFSSRPVSPIHLDNGPGVFEGEGMFVFDVRFEKIVSEVPIFKVFDEDGITREIVSFISPNPFILEIEMLTIELAGNSYPLRQLSIPFKDLGQQAYNYIVKTLDALFYSSITMICIPRPRDSLVELLDKDGFRSGEYALHLEKILDMAEYNLGSPDARFQYYEKPKYLETILDKLRAVFGIELTMKDWEEATKEEKEELIDRINGIKRDDPDKPSSI